MYLLKYYSLSIYFMHLIMEYTSEENLILQSTCNAVLLSNLSANGESFLQSEFFKGLAFFFPKVKEMYIKKQTYIGNQGMLMVCLYALLVLPKERILAKYPDNYRRVNDWIDTNKDDCTDTCTYIKEGINSEEFKHIRHLRNAVAHGNVEFDDSNPEHIICIFTDAIKNGKAGYTLEISTKAVGELITELIIAQQSYVDDIVKRQQEEEKE